jgi:oligosaccharyltransferase complex subunit alpha (ribophorin I)
VLAVYNHKLSPFPAEIGQTERQFVLYKDNHYVSSPYAVKTQKTTVKLASSKVEKRSELAPSSLKGDTITYGPYDDREPFSSSELSVHFENVKPFLTASIVTEVEVSHWGNVAVEETYQISHDGAKLRGNDLLSKIFLF